MFIIFEQHHAPTMYFYRLRMAVGTSIWMGVRHLNNTEVSTACVVFLELLGQDSLILRTYLQVGHELMHHRNGNMTGNTEQKRDQISNNEKNVGRYNQDKLHAQVLIHIYVNVDCTW